MRSLMWVESEFIDLKRCINGNFQSFVKHLSTKLYSTYPFISNEVPCESIDLHARQWACQAGNEACRYDTFPHVHRSSWMKRAERSRGNYLLGLRGNESRVGFNGAENAILKQCRREKSHYKWPGMFGRWWNSSKLVIVDWNSCTNFHQNLNFLLTMQKGKKLQRFSRA